MSTRIAKQLIYGLLYLIFWVAVGSLAYFVFLKPEPSCFDSIKNQNETGVDCGGVCANACLPILREIEIVERILTFRPAPSSLGILTRISNPNPDHAAKNFRYEFSLIGSNNQAAAVFSGSSFLYAGEVKYLLVPNVSYPATSFSRVDLRITETEWVPKSEFPGPPNAAVLGAETRLDGRNLVVSGQVVNRGTITLSRVLLVAVFRGQFGQIAGASETRVENLVPNESRAFSILHPAIANVDLAATGVFVYAR